MKNIRRLIVTLLVILSMVGQSLPIFAATETERIPIGVKYNGVVNSTVTKYLEKESGLKGYATLIVKAYSELGSAGSANDTIKVDYTYQSETKGEITQTTEIQTINKNMVTKENSTGYFVEVKENIQFDGPNSNQKRLKFYIKFTGYDKEIFTSEDIALTATNPADKYPTVQMSTINKNSQVVDGPRNIKFDNTSNQKIEVIDTPIILDIGAKVEVNVQGKELKKIEYQVIASETQPTIPATNNGSWKNLADIPEVILNTWESYPDLMKDKQGYISTKHYNYKYSSKIYGADSIPPRNETFGYPVGDNMVIQKAAIDTSNEYYNTKDEEAFFWDSTIGATIFEAIYIPNVTGSYKFGVRSNSGGYGYIKVDGKDVVIANNFGNRSGDYSTTNMELNLEAGKEYPVYMKWEQQGKYDVTPRLEYQIKTNGSWSANSIVPAEQFNNERYIGGGNKAVKFWGYIAPDESGQYNLGAYSDDGAYGYVIIGKQKVEFVEDWSLKPAFDRTKVREAQSPIISLEKGKVYPIYMEWYEGCPTNKAFVPRYKLASKTTWNNIPSTWFYASSNTTPGDLNEAYFQPTIPSTQIPLPNIGGTYYVALQITSQDNTVRQVLYGPLKIGIMKAPEIKGAGTNKNFIAPESLSNICYEVKYTEYSKGIEYVINFDELIGAQLGSDSLMKFDLVKSIVTLDGGGVALVKGTDYTLASDSNNLTITVNKSAEANSTQIINVYIPTNMKEGVLYQNNTADTSKPSYLSNYIDNGKVHNAKVTVTATPRLHETYITPDGKEVNEEYGSMPSLSSVPVALVYKSIPKIS